MSLNITYYVNFRFFLICETGIILKLFILNYVYTHVSVWIYVLRHMCAHNQKVLNTLELELQVDKTAQHGYWEADSGILQAQYWLLSLKPPN